MKTRFTSIFPRAALTLLVMMLTNISAWAVDDVPYQAEYNTTTEVDIYEFINSDEIRRIYYDANGNTSGSLPIEVDVCSINQSYTVKGNTGNLARTGYVFSGWNTRADGGGTTYQGGDTFTMGNNDITLYAKWAPTYTITWLDGDGNTLKTEQVASGQTPAYTGATPTKTATDQYTYTFNNTWDPEIVSVTGPATYTAQFDATVNKYTVTFVDEDGTELSSAEYDYGTAAEDIVRPDDPTKEATVQYTYTFNGWSPAIAMVTGNATYTATYSSTVNQYTVTFEDEDGTELSSAEYAYGTAAADIVRPADPTKAATAQYTYTFNGWSPAIAMVTDNATYTATYSSVENPIVAYIDADGNVHDDLDHSTETTEDDGVQAIPLNGTETTLGRSGVDPDNNNKPYETWYVCNTAATANEGNGLTYTSGLTLNGNVHIILADGCKMTVTNSSDNAITGNKSIAIYGQSTGDNIGSLSVTGGGSNNYGISIFNDFFISHCNVTAVGSGDGIHASGDITINGGQVDATGTSGSGIYSVFTLSIGNCTVTAEGSTYGLYGSQGVTINGGQVTATGTSDYGIKTVAGPITLGWTAATDFIKANSYYGIVQTADGKALKYTDDDDKIVKLIGDIADLDDIADRKLTAYGYGGYCGNADLNDGKNLRWDIPLVDDDDDDTTPLQPSNVLTITKNPDVNEGEDFSMADYTGSDTPWMDYSLDLILVGTEADYAAYVTNLNDDDQAKLAPTTITIAKNESGWSTFCHNYPVAYSLSDNASAHSISGLSDNNTNVSISDDLGIAEPAIPLLLRYSYEGENVILTAQPETAPAAVSSTAIVSSDFEGGSFYGNCSNTFVSPADLDDSYDEGQTYLLYNGKFIQADENGGLGAHKCLLVLSGTNNAPVLTIGEGTTNITTTNYTNFTNSDGAWYSLDGRRIANGQKPKAKGVYIYNSKKVVIK